MTDATRSELTRLWRRGFALGWLGITALFCAVITVFVFQGAADGTTAPSNAPGGGFPSAAELAEADGLVAGLGTAATFSGVVALSFWAVAVASDYSTGLIRLLVQAQPGRVRLLAGKVLALTVATVAVAAVATVASVVVAPLMAQATGVPTAAWGEDAVATVATAWLNSYVALLVWGVIGLVIAVLTRSAAMAIAGGVSYVLVVEGLVGLLSEDLAEWLPGATLTALAGGGTASVPYATALGLGALYATIGLVSASLAFMRRDVVD